MIKIWADLFDVLFSNTGVYVRWGEKSLMSQNESDRVIFKLDAKFVLLYDGDEYPTSCSEFAPYTGVKKIKSDRSKLLVEAKTIFNKAIGLNMSKHNESNLKIVNIQVIGLEAHVASVELLDNNLYLAKSIQSFTTPTTVTQLKKESKNIIGNLFDFKIVEVL